MNICDKLKLKDQEVISFVGGGGKTTTITELADELKNLGEKVLITTTTAMLKPEEYDYCFLKTIEPSFKPSPGSITVFAHRIEGKKLRGEPVSYLEEIIDRDIFDYVLIEADGARQKPIKAPVSNEPVILKDTTKTVGIIGLDALGERIIDIAYEPEYFSKIIGRNIEDIIEEQDIVNLVRHNKGLFKDSMGDKIFILNKANNEELIKRSEKIRNLLIDSKFSAIIVITDILKNKFY